MSTRRRHVRIGAVVLPPRIQAAYAKGRYTYWRTLSAHGEQSNKGQGVPTWSLERAQVSLLT